MLKQKPNDFRRLALSALGAFAFAVVTTGSLGSGFFDNLQTRVDGFNQTSGEYCEYTDYDAYGPTCETCYDALGNSQGEECRENSYE